MVSTNFIFSCVSRWCFYLGENILCDCLQRDGMAYTQNNDTYKPYVAFKQVKGEQLHEGWMRFRALLGKCSQLGLPELF